MLIVNVYLTKFSVTYFENGKWKDVCNKETCASRIDIIDGRHPGYNYIQFYIRKPRDQVSS